MNPKLKVCMIGATSVGKTSLVARYVSSIFSETYRTTIGVRIETRRVERPAGTSELVLWDLSGEDEFQSVRSAYLRGAAGYLIVVDGTRRDTLDTALSLQAKAQAQATTGDVPFVIALNKADRVADWDVDAKTLKERESSVVRTSAKTGEGVEDAFNRLVDAMHRRGAPWT